VKLAQQEDAMAMLDFIKNRQQQKPQNQPQQSQKPEPTKNVAAEQSAHEKATAMVNQMKPQERARVEEVKTNAEAYLKEVNQNTAPAPAPASADGASSPQPMAQKMMSQDKAAPELSPTSAQKGTRATEQEAPRQTEDKQAQVEKNTQERSRQERAKGQSWER
jgi:hypothetical protein